MRATSPSADSGLRRASGAPLCRGGSSSRSTLARKVRVSCALPSISTYDYGLAAGALDEADLVGAVVVDRGAEELERLALSGPSRQVVLDQIGGLVRVGVQAPVDPVTADLAHPRELVLRTVDAEAVDGVLEWGVVVAGRRRRPRRRIGLRRRGQRNGCRRHGDA